MVENPDLDLDLELDLDFDDFSAVEDLKVLEEARVQVDVAVVLAQLERDRVRRLVRAVPPRGRARRLGLLAAVARAAREVARCVYNNMADNPWASAIFS